MLKEKYSSMLLGSNFLCILTIRRSVTSPLHVWGDHVIEFVGNTDISLLFQELCSFV